MTVSSVTALPVLPLRDIVVFPQMIVPLFVGREKSIKALEAVMAEDKQIILVTQTEAGIEDPDGDGLPNLIEFFLGSLPGKNDAGVRGPRASIMDANGEDYLTFSFSQVLGQSDLVGVVEASSNLTDWSSSSVDIKEILPVVLNGNGSVRRTFRVPVPVSEVTKQFLRLRVVENQDGDALD